MAHIITIPADYSAGVPRVEPSPTPPDDYQHLQVNPNQFGAQVGQGAEQLAAGALKAGDFFGQVAADDQSNKWQREAENLLHGTGQIGPDGKPDLGIMGLTGEDALRAYPAISAKMDALREHYKGGLLTGQSQLQFENFTRRYQSMLMERIASHVDQQAKVYGVSVNDATLANGYRTIATNYNDEPHVLHTMEDNRLAAGKKAELQGKSKEGAIAEADSNSVKARIEGAIANNDSAAGKKIFDAQKHRLDYGVRAALAGQLRAQDTATRTYGAGMRALGMAQGEGGAQPSDGGLWGRIKGAEGGVGRNGEALVSPKGAIGVSQIIPSTAEEMATDLGLPYDERRLHTDPTYNETLGKGYLDKMLARYGGNEALASAAYNAGPERVDNWLKTIGDPRTGALTDAQFAQKIPIAETRGYVQKIIAGTLREGIVALPATGAAATPGSVEVWGDSLGVGLQGQMKGAGKVVGGITPSAILDNIKAQPADYWQGKTVALPSGSNGNQMPIVEDTIKYLKDNGAKVIAVGYGPKFPEKNAALAEIAARQNIPVVAAEGVGASEGVHPSPAGYQAMARKIGALAAQRPAGTPAATSQPIDEFTNPELAAQINAAPAAGEPIPLDQTGAPDQVLGQPPAPPGGRPAGNAAAQPTIAANRTGLPMPDEIARRIWADPTLHNDAERAQAFAHAESVYRTQEASLAQKERIRAQEDQQQLHDVENEIYADVYSAHPKVTPQQIAIDPRFNSNPERRKQMIELINNPPGSGVPTAQSYAAAQALVDRIRLPYGTNGKITDPGQVYAEMRTLNRPDLEFVLKTLTNSVSPGRERFNQREKDFLDKSAPMITQSNPLAGKKDPIGDAQRYNYERALDAKVDEYIKANKNPDDLLNPAKPDFFGRPETLQSYQSSFQQSLKHKTDALTAVPSWPLSAGGTAAPGAPPASPMLRRPGETPQDFMTRIGRMPPPEAPAR